MEHASRTPGLTLCRISITLGAEGQDVTELGSGLAETDLDAEVVVDKDPLVVGELAQIADGDHLDQLEGSQQQVGVAGDLACHLHLDQLLLEDLHQEGQQHGPDVDEQLVD